jgi:hypothetical protein
MNNQTFEIITTVGLLTILTISITNFILIISLTFYLLRVTSKISDVLEGLSRQLYYTSVKGGPHGS